jgi:hypothetical protein
MARLGHSSPHAAMIYQHAAEDSDRLIAERLAVMTAEAGLAPAVPIDKARSRPQRLEAVRRAPLPPR